MQGDTRLYLGFQFNGCCQFYAARVWNNQAQGSLEHIHFGTSERQHLAWLHQIHCNPEKGLCHQWTEQASQDYMAVQSPWSLRAVNITTPVSSPTRHSANGGGAFPEGFLPCRCTIWLERTCRGLKLRGHDRDVTVYILNVLCHWHCQDVTRSTLVV